MWFLVDLFVFLIDFVVVINFWVECFTTDLFHQKMITGIMQETLKCADISQSMQPVLYLISD